MCRQFSIVVATAAAAAAAAAVCRHSMCKAKMACVHDAVSLSCGHHRQSPQKKNGKVGSFSCSLSMLGAHLSAGVSLAHKAASQSATLPTMPSRSSAARHAAQLEAAPHTVATPTKQQSTQHGLDCFYITLQGVCQHTAKRCLGTAVIGRLARQGCLAAQPSNSIDIGTRLTDSSRAQLHSTTYTTSRIVRLMCPI
jgi:hypothetical protein